MSTIESNKVAAIVMPLYGKDNPIYFFECLSSVFSMSGDIFHVFLFCDGNITKDLLDIIEDESYRDNFTVYFREKNKGIAVTLNELIEHVLKFSSFKYIVRMDSDDICLHDRLIKQIGFMEQNFDVDISGAACIEFGSAFAKKGVKTLPSDHRVLSQNIFKQCPFIHPTVIFRRRIFEAGHRYPTNTLYTEDLAFWFSLLHSGFKFANISDPVIKYRTSYNMIKRRKGIKKAWHELRLRLRYIFLLKRFSPKDIAWSFAHFFIRILPSYLYGLIYKRIR